MNIERLKVRRSELLYCSKRARHIPIHKQLSIFQNPNKAMSKSRLLGQHLINVRTHKLSRFRTFNGFISRALHRPFTTMMETLKQSTSSSSKLLQAIALKGKKTKSAQQAVLSTEGVLKRKIQSIFQAYFVSSSALFYGEMLFLRAKLQWYRVIQIGAIKWFLRSFKSNYGLYFCAAFYVAYFGHLRKKYMFVKVEDEKLKDNLLKS